jgi:thiosulfate reductase cytochrome b subunit
MASSKNGADKAVRQVFNSLTRRHWEVREVFQIKFPQISLAAGGDPLLVSGFLLSILCRYHVRGFLLDTIWIGWGLTRTFVGRSRCQVIFETKAEEMAFDLKVLPATWKAIRLGNQFCHWRRHKAAEVGGVIGTM